jgi:hypothetical protein
MERLNKMCLREFRVFNVKTDRAVLTTGLEGDSYRHIALIKIKPEHMSTEVIILMQF